MLWPWPELVLPRALKASYHFCLILSSSPDGGKKKKKCRHNIPSMCDFCAFVLKKIYFPRSLLK